MTIMAFSSAGLFFAISKASPMPTLSAERPHPNIFCAYVFLSILGQFAMHSGFLIFCYHTALDIMPQARPCQLHLFVSADFLWQGFIVCSRSRALSHSEHAGALQVEGGALGGAEALETVVMTQSMLELVLKLAIERVTVPPLNLWWCHMLSCLYRAHSRGVNGWLQGMVVIRMCSGSCYPARW